MIVRCMNCDVDFEDNYRSTLCPHRAFPANDGSNNFAIHNDAYISKKEGSQYDADYFLHGRQTGKSLYENYHWMPELTVPMVSRIVSCCNIRPSHMILDFGCARGYTVRAMRELGYNAWGHDISQWALDNADESVKDFLICNNSVLFANSFDWVIAKDVLEHIPQVADTITDLMSIARVGVFAVVPLGYGAEGYVVPEYDLDITHIHRCTLTTWAGWFIRPGWSVTMAYRVPGVKDNYSQHEMGNGFIIAKRIETQTCRQLD